MLTDYKDALAAQSPGRGAEILHARIGAGQRTNERVVAWVHALARAQDKYAHELESVLKKHTIILEEMGTLASGWQAVVASVHASAQAATTFSNRLLTEVEEPLGALAAKSFPRAHEILNDLDRTTVTREGSWVESMAPQIAKIQELDTARLNALRDSLTQLQTLGVDFAGSIQRSAEAATQELLNFDAKDDVQSYVAQIVSGAVAAPPVSPEHSPHHRREPSSGRTTFMRKQDRKVSKSSIRDQDSTYSTESRKTSLRAKVGTLFGRRKKDRHPEVRTPSSQSRVREVSPEEHLESQAPRTQPPDFGLQVPATLSESRKAPAPPPQRKRSLNRSNRPDTAEAPPDVSNSDARDPNSVGMQDPKMQDPKMQDLKIAGPPKQNQPGQIHGYHDHTERRAINSMIFAEVEPAKLERPTVPELKEHPEASPDDLFYTPAQQFPATMGQDPFARTASGAGMPSEEGNGPRAARSSGQTYNAFTTPQNTQVQAQAAAAAPAPAHLQRNITGDVDAHHPPSPHEQGLVATIAERIECTSENGDITSTSITGEINVLVNGSAPESRELVLQGASNLTSLVPNAPLAVQGPERGNLVLDPKLLSASPALLAKYVASNATDQVVLVFKPTWRVDQHQSRLMLIYEIPESYPHDRVTIHKLVVAVSVTGGHANSAQSKPFATFSRDRQRVTWRITEPITLQKGTPGRLLCQFATDGPAHEAPGGIEARFEVHGSQGLIAPTLLSSEGTAQPVPASIVTYFSKYVVSS